MKQIGAFAAAIILISTAILGCGGDNELTPEVTVRRWVEAVARDDNEAAASLFQEPATISQGGQTTLLKTHADALTWNAGLPCSAEIEHITSLTPDALLVRFRLASSTARACDGPGAAVEVDFIVRNGRIVSFHQRGAPLELTG